MLLPNPNMSSQQDKRRKRILKKRRYAETVTPLFPQQPTPLAKRPKTCVTVPDAGQPFTAFFYDTARGLPLTQLPKQFKVVSKSDAQLVTLNPLNEKIVFALDVPAGEDLISTCNNYIIPADL